MLPRFESGPGYTKNGVMNPMEDEFDNVADLAKQLFDHVAVCRCSHGHEHIFTVPFETRDQLEDFLHRNNGDCAKTGFYARGFSYQEYIGENT